jgi:hypothetical protein
MGDSHQPWGFEVPGGFVTTEVRGGVSFLVSLGRNFMMPSARGVEQDIVVMNSTKERELYREGHYNNSSVQAPLRKIVHEIEQFGVSEFVRTRQIENSQIGPVQAPSGRLTFPDLTYIRAWLSTRIHRRKSE